MSNVKRTQPPARPFVAPQTPPPSGGSSAALRLEATVRAATDLVGGLGAVIKDLDGYVAERAQELAREHIRIADGVAGARIAEAEATVQRRDDLVAELRRCLAAADKARELALRERDEATAAIERLRTRVADQEREIGRLRAAVADVHRRYAPDAPEDLLYVP